VLGVKVKVEEKEGAVLIRLEGRIDAASTPVLENKIRALLDTKDRILFDFAKVDYLSSAGLRLLLSATKKLKSRGGHLVSCNIADDVMEIIKMAGFERVLSIYSTEQEALTALGK